MVIAECSGGQGERTGNSHINASLLVDIRLSQGVCPRAERDSVREQYRKKETKSGGGWGEKIT